MELLTNGESVYEMIEEQVVGKGFREELENAKPRGLDDNEKLEELMDDEFPIRDLIVQVMLPSGDNPAADTFQDVEYFPYVPVFLEYAQEGWEKSSYNNFRSLEPFDIPSLSVPYQDLFQEFQQAVDLFTEKKTQPKNVALMLLYIIQKLNQYHLNENLQNARNIVARYFQFSLKDLFKDYDKIKKTLKEDQLQLTKKGQELLFLLLGIDFLRRVKEGDENYVAYGSKQKRVEFEDLFDYHNPNLTQILKSTYHKLCDEQEMFFMKQKVSVPYLLSEWDKEQPLPWWLPMKRQSLANLRIIINDFPDEQGKIVEGLDCIPCTEGYERYRGSLATVGGLFQNAKYDSNKNLLHGTQGYCVQRLDSLLQEVKLDPDYYKTLPWYLKWLGSVEQAEKRLKKYRENQQMLYDSNSPNYDFLDYYMTILILRMDVALKRMYGLTEKQSGVYKAPKKLISKMTKNFGDKAERAAQMFDLLLNSTYHGTVQVVSTAPLLFVKIMDFIIHNPLMTTLLHKLLENMIESLCANVSFVTIKQQLVKEKDGSDSVKQTDGPKVVRNAGKGVYEIFFFEEGRWIKADVENRINLASETKKREDRGWQDLCFGFLNALSSFVENKDWKKLLDVASLGTNTLYLRLMGYIFDALEMIPLVGAAIKKIGRKEFNNIILGFLVVQGNKVLRRMVQSLNKVNQLYRLTRKFLEYITMVLTGNCFGDMIIMEGKILGKELGRSLGKHFELAIYNLPYYAMLILCEEEYLKLRNKSANREVIITRVKQLMMVGAKASKSKLRGSRKRNDVADKGDAQQALYLEAKRLLEKYRNIEKEILNAKRNSKDVRDAFKADSLRQKARNALETFFKDNNKEELWKIFEREDKNLSLWFGKSLNDTIDGKINPRKSFWQRHWRYLAMGAAVVLIGGAVFYLSSTIVASSSITTLSVADLGAKAKYLNLVPIINKEELGTFVRDTYNGKDTTSTLQNWVLGVQKRSGTSGTGAVMTIVNNLKHFLLNGTITNILYEFTSKFGAIVGTQRVRSVYEKYDSAKVFFQDSFSYRLNDVLNQSQVRKAIFNSKLREYLDRFSMKKKVDVDRNEFLFMKATIASKNSVDLPLVVYDKTTLNVVEITNFFLNYGEMASEIY